MPPSFIRRISRSSSDLVTDDPNHHQRIMILASSGGRSNPLWSSVMVCARVGENAIRSKQTIWSAPSERSGVGAMDSNLKIDLATDLSIITKALRIIAVSKVKSIDVALIEDERSTKT